VGIVNHAIDNGDDMLRDRDA
jgi:hypothetical protein